MHKIFHTINVDSPCNIRCNKTVHYDMVYVSREFWIKEYENNLDVLKRNCTNLINQISPNQKFEIHDINFPRETISVFEYYKKEHRGKEWENSIPVGVYYSISVGGEEK